MSTKRFRKKHKNLAPKKASLAQKEEIMKSQYMEMRMLQQKIKETEEKIEQIDSQAMELEYIKLSLDEIKDVKKGTEILAPISNGIFIKAKIEDSSEIYVNVGSDCVAVETPEKAKALIQKQIDEVSGFREKLVERYQLNVFKIKSLEQELQKLVAEIEEIKAG